MNQEESDEVIEMALVLDIPFKELERAEREVKVCNKAGADGMPCRREALAGKDVCGVHERWSDIESQTGFAFPDEAMAVQELLGRTAAMLAMKVISVERAEAVAHLCQLMITNLKRIR